MNKRMKNEEIVSVIEPHPSAIYLDRELSQLAFNRRVLAQAEDSTVPALERLKYLCIVSNNLDEFFEVRIASLLANRIEGEQIDPPSLAAALGGTNADCYQIVP